MTVNVPNPNATGTTLGFHTSDVGGVGGEKVSAHSLYTEAGGVATAVSPTNPLPVSGLAAVGITPKHGTIAAASTSQLLMAANAARRQFFIQNDPGETDPLRVEIGAAAGAQSLALLPGQTLNWPTGTIPTAAINVWASAAGHKFSAWECA